MLGPDHPDVAVTLHNLAILAMQEKRNEDAEALFRRDLAITEKNYGPDHPETASSLATLAIALDRLERPAEALAALERALAIRRRALAIRENAGDDAGAAEARARLAATS